MIFVFIVCIGVFGDRQGVTRSLVDRGSVHVLTQVDWKDVNAAQRLLCRVSGQLGKGSILYGHGLNKTTQLSPGEHCKDCYKVPDLHGSGFISANPTAWPKIRFWQHTLNRAAELGIRDNDLCVAADGLDVLPTRDAADLLQPKYFPKGIVFSADSVCHPFCTTDGCWSWGLGHVYRGADGPVRGELVCDKLKSLSHGKFLCAGLYMGRCSLIRKLLNRLDDIIREDGKFGGYYDQALFQIAQFRYPDLEITVDYAHKYFKNMHGERHITCSSAGPFFLHFNGDSKDHMKRCWNTYPDRKRPWFDPNHDRVVVCK